MKHHLLLLCILLTVTGSVSAQTSASRESAIKAYIKQTDNLITTHNPNIKQKLAKGTVESQKTITEYTNASTRVHSTIGNYSKTITTSANGKQLLKLEYTDSTDQLFNEAYYYQNNQLIAAIEVLRNAETHIIMYRREQYFDKGVAFSTNSSDGGTQLTDKNKNRMATPLLDKGNRYLNDFLDAAK